MDDTDYVQLDEDVEPNQDSFTCSVCGDILPTEKGRKIHESRMHGVKSAPGEKKRDTSKPSPSGTGKRKKPPLFNNSTKLTRTSRDLSTDLAAAGVAYLAIRWVKAQGIPVMKTEEDQFLIGDADRGKMFKPILDGLEQFSPAVKILNTIAERFDYIQCFMLWKAYASNVREFADARKEGVEPNGTTRQGTIPDPGTVESGFIRTAGFSPADFS